MIIRMIPCFLILLAGRIGIALLLFNLLNAIEDLRAHSTKPFRVDAVLFQLLSFARSFRATGLLALFPLKDVLLAGLVLLLVVATLALGLFHDQLAIDVESQFAIGGKLGIFANLALNLLLSLLIWHQYIPFEFSSALHLSFALLAFAFE